MFLCWTFSILLLENAFFDEIKIKAAGSSQILLVTFHKKKKFNSAGKFFTLTSSCENLTDRKRLHRIKLDLLQFSSDTKVHQVNVKQFQKTVWVISFETSQQYLKSNLLLFCPNKQVSRKRPSAFESGAATGKQTWQMQKCRNVEILKNVFT